MVRTTADEVLDSARENTKSAYKDLLRFLDPDTYSTSDYTTTSIDDIQEALILLRKVRTLLG